MLSVSEARTRLLIPEGADETLLGELVAAAESFARAYCGRDFTAGTFVEVHPGGRRYVFLQRYPVSAVEIEGVADHAYRVHAQRGVLEATGSRFPAGDLSVTVTVPPLTTPPAVTRAVADLVGHWYRQAKTHAATGQMNVRSTSDSSGTSQTFPASLASGYQVPAGVLEVLRQFRTPPV